MKSRMIEKRTVVQGIGSGLPENQSLLGSKSPQADAKLASLSPEEQAEMMKRYEEIRVKASYILECIEEGWSCIFTKEELTNFETLESSKVSEQYESAKVWRKEKVDKEAELSEDYNIPIDDPRYNPVADVRRKKAVESKVTPMDFTSMIFQGYCDQEIPIKDNFKVVFRTLSTHQSLWIEGYLVGLQDKSMQYIRHYSSLLQLAMCMQSINGKEIVPAIDSSTLKSEEKMKATIEKRMEFIGNLPQIITDDLITHYTWFILRVRKLLGEDSVSKLGN